MIALPTHITTQTTFGKPWSEGKKHNRDSAIQGFDVSGDMSTDMSSIMRAKKMSERREEGSSRQRSLHLRYTSNPAKGSSEREGYPT